MRMSGGDFGDPAALVVRRVAGADRRGRDADLEAHALGRVVDPDQRRAQVALDVDGERLQR